MSAPVKDQPRIVLYSRDIDRFRMELKEMIEELVVKENVEPYQTIPDLVSRLNRPRCEPLIAVILIADTEELGRLFPIRSVNENVRIILVLPDDSPDIVANGHRLRPRYVTSRGGNLKDLQSVLARMVETRNQPARCQC